MNRPHTRRWLTSLFAAVGVLVIFGVMYMNWFNQDKRRLDKLLTDAGHVLTAQATIKAWTPDLNYDPQAYYLVRSIDEANFKVLVQHVALPITAASLVPEGTWELPAGVELVGWSPPNPPVAPGVWQAQGQIGKATVWIRWSQGQMFMVAMPASP